MKRHGENNLRIEKASHRAVGWKVWREKSDETVDNIEEVEDISEQVENAITQTEEMYRPKISLTKPCILALVDTSMETAKDTPENLENLVNADEEAEEEGDQITEDVGQYTSRHGQTVNSCEAESKVGRGLSSLQDHTEDEKVENVKGMEGEPVTADRLSSHQEESQESSVKVMTTSRMAGNKDERRAKKERLLKDGKTEENIINFEDDEKEVEDGEEPSRRLESPIKGSESSRRLEYPEKGSEHSKKSKRLENISSRGGRIRCEESNQISGNNLQILQEFSGKKKFNPIFYHKGKTRG